MRGFLRGNERRQRCDFALRFSSVTHGTDSFWNRKMGLEVWCQCRHLESLLENTEVSRGSTELPWWSLWWEAARWSGKGTEMETRPPGFLQPSVFQRARWLEMSKEQRVQQLQITNENFSPFQSNVSVLLMPSRRKSQFGGSVSITCPHHLLFFLL